VPLYLAFNAVVLEKTIFPAKMEETWQYCEIWWVVSWFQCANHGAEILRIHPGSNTIRLAYGNIQQIYICPLCILRARMVVARALTGPISHGSF